MAQIKVIIGDITTLNVDAIVNAANSKLAGGGGVDGAIHRAAGPELLTACQQLGGCRAGSAKLTKAYRLPSRYVIHAVGPIWKGGHMGEAELLASCYHHSLEIAVQHDIKSIAFPAISCGVYRFPIEQAARIAVKEVRNFLTQHHAPETVIFACFNQENFAALSAALGTTDYRL